jgi:predicted secreted protein
MRLIRTLFISSWLWVLPASSLAQNVAYPPPQNVLQLQSSGSVEVHRDMLSMNMTTTIHGTEAGLVQKQLKVALDAALKEALKTSLPGHLDVRTGNFALYPRHTRNGRISGWTGNAELVLKGRDFPRITQAAGQIQTMSLGGLSFRLSREQRAKAESDAQTIAIQGFTAKAAELAKGFGFTEYELREVSVNASNEGLVPPGLAKTMPMESMAADATVPVEPGKTAVTVVVSGSVQMRTRNQ